MSDNIRTYEDFLNLARAFDLVLKAAMRTQGASSTLDRPMAKKE